jgi:hypothetical protein
MRSLQFGVLVLSALASANCGGGGANGPPLPAGHYVGTWDAPALPENGTADITVDANGGISGTVTSSALGANGAAQGLIHASGSASFGAVWQVNNIPIGWSNQGTLHFAAPNTVSGVLRRNVGDGTVPVEWSLTLQ